MKKIASSMFVFFICIVFWDKIFTKYEYKIGDFFVNCVNYVKTGKFKSFHLDKNGIPTSFTPSVGIYVSPFYVVQACILYLHRNNTEYSTAIGEVLDGWPQEIPYNSTEKQFENCLNYILSCYRESANKGKHVFYDFDWYSMRKPWFSGLTDAMTLFLFQQLYQKTRDLKFLQISEELYKNLIQYDIVKTDSGLYVEEYIGAGDAVFNGLVIAALCVFYYEKQNLISDGVSKDLMHFIRNNVKLYDLEFYTKYSLTHVANKKYHQINKKCIRALWGITQDPYWEELLVKWDRYDDISFIKKHFLILMHLGKFNCRLDIVSILFYFSLIFTTISILFAARLVFRNKLRKV